MNKNAMVKIMFGKNIWQTIWNIIKIGIKFYTAVTKFVVYRKLIKE